MIFLKDVKVSTGLHRTVVVVRSHIIFLGGASCSGFSFGTSDGFRVGSTVFSSDGSSVGSIVGELELSSDGWLVGGGKFPTEGINVVSKATQDCFDGSGS